MPSFLELVNETSANQQSSWQIVEVLAVSGQASLTLHFCNFRRVRDDPSANGPPAIHARQVQVLDQEGAIL